MAAITDKQIKTFIDILEQVASRSGSNIDNVEASYGESMKYILSKMIYDEATEAAGSVIRKPTSGYYALLTDFYFDGAATETIIPVEDVDTWIDVNFTTAAAGEFDYRPEAMINENPNNAFDNTTNLFSLEGLTIEDFGAFRASMSFDPDEDNGEFDARLLFERHSGTTPSEPFSIEDIVATMNQGADTDYPIEAYLTYFIGDTVDTNGSGDSGKCKFQVKSSVAGTLSMRAMTWYLFK